MKIFSFDTKSVKGKIKISKAQKSTLTIVGATTVVVGAGIALIMKFSDFIKFDDKVIAQQKEAIAGYTDALKNSGACKAPRGAEYNQDELLNCDPNETEPKDVPGTLRASILDDASSIINFESVARDAISVCIDPETSEPYSSSDLKEKYMEAETSNEQRYYMNAIKICSTLRVIPDALPIVRNDVAVLSSVGKIYLLSGQDPNQITLPTSGESSVEGLSSVPVNLPMEEENISKLLYNISKSIRRINLLSLTLDYRKGLEISSRAETYYTGEVISSETMKTILPEGAKKR